MLSGSYVSLFFRTPKKNVIFGLKRKKIREIVGSVDAIKMQNVISSPSLSGSNTFRFMNFIRNWVTWSAFKKAARILPDDQWFSKTGPHWLLTSTAIYKVVSGGLTIIIILNLILLCRSLKKSFVLLFGDRGVVDRVAEKILNIILSLFWHAVLIFLIFFCATAAIIKVVSKSLICGQRISSSAKHLKIVAIIGEWSIWNI